MSPRPLLAVCCATLIAVVPGWRAPAFGTVSIPESAVPVESAMPHATPAARAPVAGLLRASHSKPVPARIAHLPHERLAQAARGGDIGAALDLAGLLDACAEREDLRVQMSALGQDWGPAPDCGSESGCDADTRGLASLRDAMEEAGARALDCRDITPAWLETRGEWLVRAAELGHTEAMSCYALAGGELSPHPTLPASSPWLERWHRQGLGMAWSAWRRGDPRAAVALARAYGPRSYFRGATDDLAPADPRWHRRFSAYLTVALDLAANDSDLWLPLDADALDAADRAWLSDALSRVPVRWPLASGTPEACWHHFDIFEGAPADDGTLLASGSP